MKHRPVYIHLMQSCRSNYGINYSYCIWRIISLESMTHRYLLAELLFIIPPLSIETDNRRRGEVGYLYHLQFIAEAGSSSPNGICAEMV